MQPATIGISHRLGDRVPPMVVKELRQGLNSGGFVGLFLLFQAGMCLAHIASLFDSSPRATTLVSFSVHALLLFALLPGVAGMRIRAELNQQKYELVVLSGLDEKGLIRGVFLSVYAQALLFVVSGLPYWILQHYIGGVDMVRDLLALALMLVAATVPLGLATGLSAYRWYENLIGGIFFGLILVPGGVTFMGVLGSWLEELGTPWPIVALVLYAVFGVPLILLFLALGAVRIREHMITPPTYV